MDLPANQWAVRWYPLSRNIPEGQPILVFDGEQAVVALAFPPDYYCLEPTFMDARTFEILPLPSHWMPLPDRPQSDGAVEGGVSACRRAA
jgi:hypothetical protein